MYFCIESKNLTVDETGSDKPKVDKTAAKWNMYSDIRMKAIVDNFDNHTIIDRQT